MLPIEEIDDHIAKMMPDIKKHDISEIKLNELRKHITSFLLGKDYERSGFVTKTVEEYFDLVRYTKQFQKLVADRFNAFLVKGDKLPVVYHGEEFDFEKMYKDIKANTFCKNCGAKIF